MANWIFKFVGVTALCLAAIIHVVFYLMSLPYFLWRPVFEGLYDWCFENL